MTLGQVAYDAYRNHSEGKSLISGSPIPEWAELREDIQMAWEVSAQAVDEFDDPERNYIQRAIKTESPSNADVLARLSELPRVIHGLMGLVTETGELVDTFKRHIFYGAPIDETNVREEIGDVFWYLAVLCDAHQFSFEACMEANIAKLKARYLQQQFQAQQALQRNLENERAVLEANSIHQ